MVIAKKKGLYLGLIVSLLGIGNLAQGNRLTIKNKTKRDVEFTISYYAGREASKFCRSDKGELAAGETKNIRSGFCAVKRVEGKLRHPRPDSNGRVLRPLKITVEHRVPLARTGNTTWTIEGPFHGSKGVEYKIVGGLD